MGCVEGESGGVDFQEVRGVIVDAGMVKVMESCLSMLD